MERPITHRLEIGLAPSIGDIVSAQWDGLVSQSGDDNPFTRQGFLAALEESGCVGAGTGWQPQHLIAKTDEGVLSAAMPLYVKSHSMGEYVFDGPLADALERAGRPYYPKLLSAVPFTPVTGPRILAASPDVKSAMAEALINITDANQLAAAQINFLPEQDATLIAQDDRWLVREDRQFHFENIGYRDHQDFLDRLSASRRKNLRKERQKANEKVEIIALSGHEITAEHWDIFFACYQDTGSRKWGRPYLNRAFFDVLQEKMADALLLFLAKDNEGYCAAALNLLGPDIIYGRYWGCLRDYPCLHFEMCYHRAIDVALARGLKRVEAGAQGSHKLARGYLPSATFALNYFADAPLRHAAKRFFAQEKAHLVAEDSALLAASPFRADA